MVNVATSACPEISGVALVPPDRSMVDVVSGASTHARRMPSIPVFGDDELPMGKAQPVKSIVPPSPMADKSVVKDVSKGQLLKKISTPLTPVRFGALNDASDGLLPAFKYPPISCNCGKLILV